MQVLIYSSFNIQLKWEHLVCYFLLCVLYLVQILLSAFV